MRADDLSGRHHHPAPLSRHARRYAGGRPDHPGYASNYGQRRQACWVYFSGTLDAAIWGAELAQDPQGQAGARERIYIVEPVGACEDDPNLTDRKFPGNPTRSYRSRDPLRVLGEITEWQGHSPEQLQEMKMHVARMREQGVEAID